MSVWVGKGSAVVGAWAARGWVAEGEAEAESALAVAAGALVGMGWVERGWGAD